jgi:pimeloyl-ACP methyl ester carboxylesterase
MPEFEYDGHTISYDEYGEGDRPLILIHGLLMSRRMFDRLGPEMAALGNRVITIDLLGHGRSDRPEQMSNYSMTFFARQVEALMDHLGIEQAVVGGTSLGANATLELNYFSPDRVKAMMVEMPVLDNALLAAAVIFTPIMIGLRLGEPVLRRLAAAARRIPRTNPLVDMGLDMVRQDPAPSSAVLEGLFLGSSAPHHQFRIEMTQPTW